MKNVEFQELLITESFFDMFKKGSSKKDGANMLFGFLSSWLPQPEAESQSDKDAKTIAGWAKALADEKQKGINAKIEHKRKMEMKYKELAHQQKLNKVAKDNAIAAANYKREEDALDAALKQEKLAKAKIDAFAAGKETKEGMMMWLNVAKNATKDIEPASQQAFKDLQTTLYTISHDENGDYVDSAKWGENAVKRLGEDVWREIQSNPEYKEAAAKFRERMNNAPEKVEADEIDAFINSITNGYKTPEELKNESNALDDKLSDMKAASDRVAEANQTISDCEAKQAKIDEFRKTNGTTEKLNNSKTAAEERLKTLKAAQEDAKNKGSYPKEVKDALKATNNIPEDAAGLFKYEKDGDENKYKLVIDKDSEAYKKLNPKFRDIIDKKMEAMAAEGAKGMVWQPNNNANNNDTNQEPPKLDGSQDLPKDLNDRIRNLNDAVGSAIDNPTEDQKKDIDSIIEDEIKSTEKYISDTTDLIVKSGNFDAEEEQIKDAQEKAQKTINDTSNKYAEVEVDGVKKNMTYDELKKEKEKREQAYKQAERNKLSTDELKARSAKLSAKALGDKVNKEMYDKLSAEEKDELDSLDPAHNEEKTDNKGRKYIQVNDRKIYAPDEKASDEVKAKYDFIKNHSDAFLQVSEKPEKANSESDFDYLKRLKQWELDTQQRSAAINDIKDKDDLETFTLIQHGETDDLVDATDKLEADTKDVKDEDEDDYDETKGDKDLEFDDKGLEDDDEDAKTDDDEGAKDDETKELKNPKLVWRQKTYRRGNKKFKTKSYYNKKGNSITKDEYQKKVRKYEERQKNLKDSTEPKDSTEQENSSLITISKNKVFEFNSYQTYKTKTNKLKSSNDTFEIKRLSKNI